MITKKPFFYCLLVVAMGTATAIPSGILCIAIAAVIGIAISSDVSADMKVAIPSGEIVNCNSNSCNNTCFALTHFFSSSPLHHASREDCWILVSGVDKCNQYNSSEETKYQIKHTGFISKAFCQIL